MNAGWMQGVLAQVSECSNHASQTVLNRILRDGEIFLLVIDGLID